MIHGDLKLVSLLLDQQKDFSRLSCYQHEGQPKSRETLTQREREGGEGETESLFDGTLETGISNVVNDPIVIQVMIIRMEKNNLLSADDWDMFGMPTSRVPQMGHSLRKSVIS